MPKAWAAIINDSTNRLAVINGIAGTSNLLGKVEFQPNGRGYAFCYRAGRDVFVRHNTNTFGPYHSIDSLQFSRSGKHLGYTVTRRIPGGHDYAVMIDHLERFTTSGKVTTSRFSGGDIRNLTLSDSGEHYAFLFDHHMHLDGKPLKFSIDAPRFTARDKLVYFTPPTTPTTNWQAHRIVVDGKEWKESDVKEGPYFSPNGTNVAAIVSTPRGRTNWYSFILDGKLITSSASIEHVTFSSQGQRLAFLVKDRNQQFIYNNGQATQLPTKEIIIALKFSPEGQHLAVKFYAESLGTVIRLDEKVLATPAADLNIRAYYNQRFAAEFSPDNRHFFYIGSGQGDQKKVVRNDIPGSSYDRVLGTENGQWIWFENNEASYLVVRGTNIVSIQEKLP